MSGIAGDHTATRRSLGDESLELFRYNKPGARLVAYHDRLELETGMLLSKKTHTIPWSAVSGYSVEGFGGSKLVIQTAGRRYQLDVGIGAANKIRRRLLDIQSELK